MRDVLMTGGAFCVSCGRYHVFGSCPQFGPEPWVPYQPQWVPPSMQPAIDWPKLIGAPPAPTITPVEQIEIAREGDGWMLRVNIPVDDEGLAKAAEILKAARDLAKAKVTP